MHGFFGHALIVILGVAIGIHALIQYKVSVVPVGPFQPTGFRSGKASGCNDQQGKVVGTLFDGI
jgi:hypothetical protein